MNEMQITEMFKKANFRATPQRIAVYKYLFENRTHPDADEIYKSVINVHPSFSKTTVYNALQALENAGFILKINVDSSRVRYDAQTQLHGHFICDKCKKIVDFEIEEILFELPEDFKINEKNVYYRGLCPECK